ncbi:transcriptional regulatory protein AlgP-like [Harpia harpyja]|uniref:transcriptional regulatory protein AlgP-like n=1 Tax=Harpia harpyja TaxID=202280 RepID=UPI0022B0B846|nr:transcriptional regulatory protein AlgP-like [Harpia harpyja]
MALGTAPASGCVTRNRGLTLRSPRPRPPEEARWGRAGPPRPLTSGQKQSCPELLPRAAAPSCCPELLPRAAAPSCCPELLPQARAAPAAAPRENRRCRAAAPPRRAHRRLPQGRRRGKSARNAPASRRALPRAFPFACGKGSRRVPREAVRRQPGPERPLRREEPRSARCRPRPLGLALPAATPGPAARLRPGTSWPPAPRPCRDCPDFPRQPHERLVAHSSSTVATDVTSYLQKLIIKIAALPR